MTLPTINKSEIAIFSDLHLGVHNNSHNWHQIAYDWVKWFKNKLIERDIVDIIFCGDWYHERSAIGGNTLHISNLILNELKDFNLLMLIGNHDIYFKYRRDVNSLSILGGRDNISIIDNPLSIRAFNKKMTFCPWGTTLEEIEDSDILFGHFELESFKMNTFKMCSEGIKIKDILNKAKIIFSGHFHRRQTKKYANQAIYYVGNPFHMDFGDVDNEKGFYLFDIKTEKLNFVANEKSPLYKKILLSDIIKEKTITDKVENWFTGNFVKLIIDKNITSEHLNIILSYLNKLYPSSLETEYESQYNKIFDAEKNDEKINAIDISQAIVEFINMLDIENKESVIKFTLDLYKKCKNEKG